MTPGPEGYIPIKSGGLLTPPGLKREVWDLRPCPSHLQDRGRGWGWGGLALGRPGLHCGSRRHFIFSRPRSSAQRKWGVRLTPQGGL